MGLPLSALQKLAVEFRAAIGSAPPELRGSHTLPIRRDRWNAYAEPFDTLIHDFAEVVLGKDGIYVDYAATKAWLTRIADTRRQIHSVLLALGPFVYFDTDRATRLIDEAQMAVWAVADAVEQGRRPNIETLGMTGAPGAWALSQKQADDFRLGVAFGLDFEPLNEDREFQASAVFSAYAYQASALVAQVLPHLMSLGVPVEAMANDMLAGVSIVGWIVGSQDPVFAATTLGELLAALLHPASRQVADSALKMFTDRENITLQVRRKIASSLASVSPNHDSERRALVLADAYKSLVEGPVRHFGWALFNLESGSWSSPPTLARVRDALVAHGGFVGRVAATCIITNLRNGQAHETLEWDGIQGCFRAEGDTVNLDQVFTAVVLAHSFDKGCESALACYRALRLIPGLDAPAGDPLRMPSRERALAFFGTNGLDVVRADFNASVARVQVSEFERRDINPCFQALLSASQLLPGVARFEVSLAAGGRVVIGVGRAALDSTRCVWSEARSAFDNMPLSTFLPANLDARSEVEPEAIAVRSVSWIAADDLLSAIDGAGDWLTAEGILLLSKRAHLVETALTETMPRVPARLHVRPRVLLDTSRELRRELAILPAPTPFVRLDDLNCVAHLRHFWATWGPVPRLPTVAEPTDETPDYGDQPAILNPPAHAFWQTL